MRIELLGRRFLFKSWNVKGGALKSKLSPLTTTTLISMKRRRGSFSIPSIEIFPIKLRQTSSWLLCKVHKKSGHFPGETHWAETPFFIEKYLNSLKNGQFLAVKKFEFLRLNCQKLSFHGFILGNFRSKSRFLALKLVILDTF